MDGDVIAVSRASLLLPGLYLSNALASHLAGKDEKCSFQSTHERLSETANALRSL